MDCVVFRLIWVNFLNTVKEEFLEVETLMMVYVKVVLVVLRCVWFWVSSCLNTVRKELRKNVEVC